jgi:MFS family permease
MLKVYLLQISNFFSGLANSLVVIAIPWLVLETSDSPALAGLVVAVSSIPSLVISPMSGIFIQKFGKRFVSITADFFSMISVVAFPVFALLSGLNVTGILILALIGAVFDPVGYTARKTLITSVSASSGFNVDRHNGIHEGLFGVSWIAGPALGAWLITLLGVINTFWVAGACFAIAALAIALLKVSDVKESNEESDNQGSTTLKQTLKGFSLLWNDRLLRTMTLSVLIIASVYLPTESVVLTTHYERLNEPSSLGIVISAISAGSAVTAFGYGWLIQYFSGRTLLRIAFIGASLSTLAMSFLPSLPFMVLGAILLGLSWGPFSPLMNSLIQQRISERDHGLVFGAQGSAFYAAPPIGMVLTGLAVEQFGISSTYSSLGILLVLTAVITLLTRALRESF